MSNYDWYGAREQTKARAGTAEIYNVGDSVKVYLVRLQDKTNDEFYALYHSEIPALRSAHPSRPYLWLSKKSARQADENNGQLWEVVCEYTLNNGAEYPWLEPPIYSGGQNSTEAIIDYDLKTEKPIRNSAACAFDPGLTATRYDYTLTCSRNELNFDYSLPSQYVGAVNKNEFYGAEAGYCMCVGIPWATQWYADESNNIKTMYSSVQYNFAFRNVNGKPWSEDVLDAGYMKLGTGGILVPITIAGREPSSPVPLDGSGHPIEHPEEDDPVWLSFQRYPEKDFTALGV